MKHLTSFLLFVAGLTLTHAQDHISISEEKIGQSVVLYIENSWISPYTVEFEAELDNMKANRPLPIRIAVPARSRMELVRLQRPPSGRWGYKYSYTSRIGDAFNATHDNDHVYQLPFEQGKRFLIGQGYNGAFSHRGEKAIDFVMPEGTPVCAAREGLVIDVKDDSNRGCASSSCKSHGNYIQILHPDGSIANYAHLRYQGSSVKPGDKVQKGQVIGYSGNTGWSSGPHLHFDVYVPGHGGARKGVSTHFQTSESGKTLLEERKSYSW